MKINNINSLSDYNTSDYVKDVLEKTPSWILSWGNTIFILFVFLLVYITSIISYPNKVDCPTEITRVTPPVSVVPKISGEIENIYVRNKEKVQKGSPLLRIYSLASMDDVEIAKKSVERLYKLSEAADFNRFTLPEDLRMGNLADGYNGLINNLDLLKLFIREKGTTISLASLQEELVALKQLNVILDKELVIIEKDLDLTKINYDRQIELEEYGSISKVELERGYAEYLNKQRQVESFKANMINNSVSITKIKTQLNDIGATREDDYAKKIFELKEKAKVQLNEFVSWYDDHLIRSPIEGVISLPDNIKVKLFVNSGEAIISILPEDANNQIIALAAVPLQSSSQLYLGTEAQIRLDAYPHEEFGIIEASISDISLLPVVDNSSGNAFTMVKMNIPDTIQTDYGMRIPFYPRMTGRTILIKEKRSILSRIFDKVLTILK